MNCIVYGLCVPMFCSSFHALAFVMKDAPNRRMLLWISIILNVVTTLQFVSQVLETRRSLGLTLLGLPDDTRFLGWIATLSYPCAVVFADGIFTYRLFHVWGRKWWPIILPVSSMLVMLAIIASVYSTHEYIINDSAFIPLTSFGTNLYITGMISFKIWQNNRNMRLLGRSGLASIITLLLESAGIYTVYSAFTAMVAGISWYKSWPPLIWEALYLGSQQTVTSVLGIAYSLMIILVAHGRSRGVRSTATTSLNLPIERALQDEEARASNYNENSIF